MIELAQLFQDLEAAVVQQEAPIEKIDGQAEDTVVNMNKGNQQLDGAVDKARAARRKKWILLGIVRKFILPENSLMLRLNFTSRNHCCNRDHRCHRGEDTVNKILGKSWEIVYVLQFSFTQRAQLGKLALFLTLCYLVVLWRFIISREKPS